MTDSTSADAPRRFDLKQVFAFLIHPRQGVERLAAEEKPSWLTPMVVSSVTLLLYIVVSGFLRGRAAALGQVQLPADWMYWTPDMQNNYMQATQATQGPVFLYVIPAVAGLVRIWLSWLIVGGLLHLLSTLFGGRGKMSSALNVVAWAGLAYAVRDLLRVIFMLIAGHAIVNSGLSAFAAAPFLNHLLANLDVFFIWYAILMGMGLSATDNLPRGKAAVGVAIVLLLMLLGQAGLGTLTSNFSGMIISRPF